MTYDLLYQPAHRLASMIRSKEISSSELLRAHLRRIEQVNPILNAIIDLDIEGASDSARRADEAVAGGGRLGPLHGVPITIKSSVAVAGLAFECGTKLREGVKADEDAVLVRRLRQAGAVIVGTTNVPDLLVAYETDNLLYGRTNSPWSRDHTPGGSSGGEAAAIASGCSAAGMGSDGGGSVRVPSHFSGLCGLKPTPGLIPRTGHWPACVGPSALLGLIGPMARSVQDLRILLEVTAGPDPADPISAPVPLSPPGEDLLHNVKIGWFTEHWGIPVTPETGQAVRCAASLLSEQGFTTEPYTPSDLDNARQLWWTLFGVVAATLVKSAIQGREDDVHPIVQDLIAPPEEETSTTYEGFLQTWIDRDKMRAALLQQMEEFPILLSPVSSAPAFRHRERSWSIGGQTVPYAKSFLYSQVYNLLGNPAAVVPVGQSHEGLPIGVQIIGRPFEDELVLAVAARLEQAVGAWKPPPEQVAKS